MYLLPKIHKRLSDVTGRPVISNCGTPTEKVSEFLDHHLQPVMKSGKSYVKDTGDFIEKIRNLGKIPKDSFLVTVDVVGLYPSIPHEAGLNALYEKLEQRSDKKISSTDLVNMAEFVLKNNYFEFDTKVHQQISGIVIGTKFAPSDTCIFMDKVENEFLETQTIKPLVWLRYIDDIFLIWNESEEKLETFLKNLNEFHPNLRFTSEKSKTSVNFLDLTINLLDQELETNLYCKPTDCHQFLDFNSAHPLHIKTYIVYSQGLRIKRSCSSNLAIENHMKNLRGWFRNRGYPKNLVDNQLKRVIETSSISRCTRQRENGVPLVLTDHPRFSRVNSIIKQQLMFLYAEEQVKNVFTPPPFV